MRQKTAKKLSKKVIADYNQISTEFDVTRQHNWDEFADFLKYIKNNQEIIDLGCGNGRFYKFIKKERKVNYVGLDNNEKLLKLAQKNNPDAKFIEGDLTDLPLKDNFFDIALAIASFHHIPSSELRTKTLQNIHRVLKKNGLLMLSVWNLFQPKYKKYIWKSRLKSIVSLGKYDFRDTFIPWRDSGVKRYYYAFTGKELKNLIQKNGFEILKLEKHNNFVLICRKK